MTEVRITYEETVLDYICWPEYLNTSAHSNDKIFEIMGIEDRQEFCSRLYGYGAGGGLWPEYHCDDYEALMRVLKELVRLGASVEIDGHPFCETDEFNLEKFKSL